ncbi:MAG: MFS transporter [Acidimicrobiia bacterium]
MSDRIPGAEGRAKAKAPLGPLVIVLCVVNVIVALDFLGASVLLDPIGHDLHLSTGDLTWVVNGYLLTLAAPLIAAGRAADRFGAVRLTRIGLVAFAGGALVTGLAGSAELLVVGRMVQGLGASVLAATGLTLVNGSAAPADRGRVVGIWAGVGAVGSAAGPLIAGLIEAVSVWRVFFLIDVPIALLVAWLLRAQRDDPTARSTTPIGLRSVIALTAGLGLAVFAALQAPESGWNSAAVVGSAASAAVLLVWFAIEERRSPTPVLPRSGFARGRARSAATTAFVGNAAFAVVAFFASLSLQQVQDLSSVAAGGVFLAMTVPLMVLSPVAGSATRRARPSVLMAAGLAVVGVSVALFAALGGGGGLAVLVGALVLSGVGQAFVFNVSNVVAMSTADAMAGGLASGVINEVRQLGALIGLAAVGAAFAGIQGSAPGSHAEAFVTALRAPSLALAAVCIAAAIFVLRSDRLGSNPHA